MEMLSALLAILRGIPRGPADSQNFDVFFYVFLNDMLNKQSICRLFQTPWSSRDVIVMVNAFFAELFQ